MAIKYFNEFMSALGKYVFIVIFLIFNANVHITSKLLVILQSQEVTHFIPFGGFRLVSCSFSPKPPLPSTVPKFILGGMFTSR